MNTDEIGADGRGFVEASEENLGRLVVGCFVLVGTGETSYWVEIRHVDGDRLSGTVHPELSAMSGPARHDSCEIASIRREQITALGCDRYCWC